jgi:hypothetical protein
LRQAHLDTSIPDILDPLDTVFLVRVTARTGAAGASGFPRAVQYLMQAQLACERAGERAAMATSSSGRASGVLWHWRVTARRMIVSDTSQSIEIRPRGVTLSIIPP